MVKAFNTVAAAVMVDASLVKQDHDLFISGNDESAKDQRAKVIANDAPHGGEQRPVDIRLVTGEVPNRSHAGQCELTAGQEELRGPQQAEQMIPPLLMGLLIM